MQCRVIGGCGDTRIHHNQRSATAPLFVEIQHRGRHGLGGIATDQQDGFGVWNIQQRKRHATIDAEGFDRSGGC